MIEAWTRRHAVAYLLGCIGAVAATVATAGAAQPEFDERDRADITRVEAYLNELRTLRARFIQTTSTGGYAEGTVSLARPGRLRLDYAPPNRLQVFATGFWLIYVDHELENVSQIPLSATPASVLVADRVSLSGDIAVTRIERGAQTVRLHLVQTKEPDAGRLELAFSDAPLQLRDWTVVDPQGVRTRVALVDAEINAPIDRQVFVFHPPPWGGLPEVRE